MKPLEEKYREAREQENKPLPRDRRVVVDGKTHLIIEATSTGSARLAMLCQRTFSVWDAQPAMVGVAPWCQECERAAGEINELARNWS